MCISQTLQASLNIRLEQSSFDFTKYEFNIRSFQTWKKK